MDAKERFLRYVTYYTTSDDSTGTSPSTERQKDLGRLLMKELDELGLTDIRMDAAGNVLATLPAKDAANAPVLALIAHMDTAPDAPGEHVKPRIVRYEGGELAQIVITREEADARQKQADEAMALMQQAAQARTDAGLWGSENEWEDDFLPAQGENGGLNLMWGDYQATIEYEDAARMMRTSFPPGIRRSSKTATRTTRRRRRTSFCIG